MAYSFKENSYFQIKNKKEEEEIKKKAAAENLKRTAAMANVKPKQGPMPSSAPRITTKYPTLQKIADTNFNAPRRESLLTGLMESTGINPRKRETRESLAKPYSGEVEADRNAKRVMLPQVAASPLLRNALRDMGKNDLLFDIYEERDRQKNQKPKFTGIEMPQSIQRAFPVSEDDRRKELERARLINSSSISPADKLKLLRENKDLTAEGAAVRGVAREADELDNLRAKYKGISSKHELRAIIEEYDKAYEEIRNTVTGGTGKEIYMSASREVVPELMEFYENYPKEREKLMAELEASERAEQIQKNQETYSDYVRSKTETKENPNFGKFFSGYDENGKMKFGSDYVPLWTGNTLIDNFISAEGKQKGGAEGEYQKAISLNRYFENELKPLVKLYEDMEKDPVFAKRIQQKYQADSEYKKWIDGKQKTLEYYKGILPKLENNYSKATSELRKKYNEDYKKAVMGEGAYEEERLRRQAMGIVDFSEAAKRGKQKALENGGYLIGGENPEEVAPEKYARYRIDKKKLAAEAQFTETERAIYYALLDKNKTDASKYYDLLTKKYIAKNYNDTFEKAVSALEANELTQGLGMVATTLIRPIESALNIITLGGLENTPISDIDRRLKDDNTRDIQEQLGDTAGKFVASAGHSLGEMLGSMITAKMIGLDPKKKAIEIMSMGAASSGMKDAKDRGGNKAQIIASGLAQGGAERLLGMIGTDRILNMIGKGSKSILKELVKSAGGEFTEEYLTEVANALSDMVIMGDKSNYDLYKKSLIANGMSEEEAKREALRQFLVINPFEAGVTGAIAGGVMGGGNAFISTYAEGKSALTNAPEFQKFTEDIAKMDVSDLTGDAAKLQESVANYVRRIEESPAGIGQILNAGKAMSAASEFQGTPKVITTEEISKEDRDFLNKFSKGAGVNILYTTIPQVISEDGGYKGGFFVEGTNTLVVDRGTSAIDMLKQTVAHEMSHATEGTRWFDAYKRSAIRDIEGIEGKSFNALVQEKRDFYRANGVEPKDAEAEVIADYTAKLFDDHNLIDKMVKRDYNSARLMLDGMRDIYNNLKTKFTGKEIGGVEETVRYLERALGMRNPESGDSNTNLQYSINEHEKYDYTKSFEEQLEDWQKNKIPQYDSLLVRGTPETFQKIGFSPLPITINQEHINYAINNTKDIDHYITIGVLKQLPEALENPIAIIKSDTVSGRVVAILSLTNPHNGKTIIAPVEIGGDSRFNDKHFDTNAIVSILGKENAVKKLENAIKTDSATNNKLFYWNKKEAISLLQRAGLQLPGALPQDGFIHSITDTGSNVNKKIKNVTETKQFKRWFGKSKFVNEDGTPKELYHGTSRFGFTTFDLSKMDDKSTIFLADTPELASTYSGVEGVRKLKDVYGKDIEGMTMEELAEELTENSTKWNSPEESKGGTTYTVYNFQKQNELIDTVNEEIKKLSDFVDEKLVEFDRVSNLTDEEIRTRIEEELKGLETDKENSEFLQKSKYKYYTEGIPKLKKRLVTLKEDLNNYNYDKLSTPIYYLLHYTAVIPSENMGEVATLEKNIRLMNKLRKADISDGIIVEEALGGYHIELLDKKKAVSELRSEVSRGNYALYAKSENPLIVDAKGHFWNDIRGWTEGLFPPLENVEVAKDENEFYLVNKITGEKVPGADVAINSFTEEMSENKLKSFLARNAKNMAAIKYESKNTTREIAKIAKEFGFDGVMFKDIVDSGGKSNNIKYDQLKSNVYVVFSPKQVKSATDNIGTFDAENDDIRYSIQNLTPEQAEAIRQDDERRREIAAARESMRDSIREMGEKEPDDTAMSRKLDRMAMHWVDRFTFLKRFDEMAERQSGKEAISENKAYMMAMNSLNSDGTVMYIIKNGMTNLNGDVNIGKGLFEILEKLSGKDETSEFERYLVARHAAEWLASDRGGDVKTVFGVESQDREDIQRGIAETIEKEYPHFKDIAEEVYKFQRDVLLNFGVEGGLLARSDAERFFQMYPDYVPFYRSLNDDGLEGVRREFADLDAGIENAEGSTAALRSPLESIIRNTAKFVTLAKKNAVMQAIYRQANIEGMEMFVEVIPEEMYENEADERTIRRERDVVSVMVDGVRRYLRFNDRDLLETVTGMNDEKQLGSVWQFFASAGNVFKTLTTSGNAMFSIGSNVWRDIDTAYKSSDIVNPGKFAKEYGKALFTQMKNNEDFQRYLAMGGRWETSVIQNRDAIGKLYRDLSRKNDAFGKKLLHGMTIGLYEGIQSLSDTIETTPRFMEFVNTLNKTGDIQKAIYDSGEITTNFKRRGTKSRQLEALLPYTNSRFQGTKKLVDLWKGHPVRTAAKMIGVATIISLLKAGLREAVGEEDYKDLSTYTKDNFHLFAIGNGKYISIPKSQNFAILDTIADRAIEGIKEKNPEWYKNLASYVLNNVLPVDFFGGMADGIENAIKKGDARETFSGMGAGVVDTVNSTMIIGTIMQLIGNRDFKGSKIVPSQYENLKPEEQFDENTTYLARLIGKALGVSPFQIDHVLSSNFGYLAKLNESFGREKKDYLLGLGNKFVKNSVYSNEILSGFYDKKGEIDEEYDTQKRRGEPESSVAMERYFYNGASGVVSNLFKLQDEAKTPAEKENVRRAINNYIKGLSNQYDEAVTNEMLRLYSSEKNAFPYVTPDISVDEYGYSKKLSAKEYAELSQKATKKITDEYQKVMNTDVYKKMSDEDKIKALNKIKTVTKEKAEYDAFSGGRNYLEELTGENSDDKYRAVVGTKNEKDYLQATNVFYPDNTELRYKQSCYENIWKIMNGAEKQGKLTKNLSVIFAESVKTRTGKEFKDTIFDIVTENGKQAGSYTPLSITYSSVFSWTKDGVNYELPLNEKTLAYVVDVIDRNLEGYYKDLYLNGYWTEGGKTSGPRLGEVTNKDGNKVTAYWENMSPKQRNDKLSSYKGRLIKDVRAMLIEDYNLEPVKVSTVWDVEGDEEE